MTDRATITTPVSELSTFWCLPPRLLFTFQDKCHLYFGLELCRHGELVEQIQKRTTLDLGKAKFYAAEVVLILEHLQDCGVIHRDVKPENLLLTDSGHLKLIDFGCVKDLTGGCDEQNCQGGGRSPNKLKKGKRRVSFVGTADYIAPEVLDNTNVSFATDLWSLGCLVYQMLAGRPPFRAGSEYLTYQNILTQTFSYPDNFPEVAKDLVDKLLVHDQEERLGAGSLSELKSHPFFQGIKWSNVRQCEAPDFIQRPKANPDDEALDWDLRSLDEALPVKYEYVPIVR